jgi:hypothetical protein
MKIHVTVLKLLHEVVEKQRNYSAYFRNVSLRTRQKLQTWRRRELPRICVVPVIFKVAENYIDWSYAKKIYH